MNIIEDLDFFARGTHVVSLGSKLWDILIKSLRGGLRYNIIHSNIKRCSIISYNTELRCASFEVQYYLYHDSIKNIYKQELCRVLLLYSIGKD